MKPALNERSESKGFTLVELLVVISIIAILSLIGLATYSGVQKNARDARRRTDINAIAYALEFMRSPGAANYGMRGITLPQQAAFGGGVVPTDTTTSKYCINLVAAGDPTFPNFTSNDPTGWPSTGSCGDGNYWQPIPSTGYVSPGTGVIEGWHVCARLESSTGSLISNGLQVYCRSSQQ